MNDTEPKVNDNEAAETSSKPHKAYEVFIAVLAFAMIALCIIFVFLPRSTYSELEKRDLAEFPNINDYDGKLDEYTGAISHWFSDSEPYRDKFMSLSMIIRDKIKFRFGDKEEAVTFRPSNVAINEGPKEEDAPDGNFENPLANENAKVASAGIILVGSGDKVRALMAFGGTGPMTESYIKLCSEYADAFPGVQVYAMVAPNATEFYLPDKASKCSAPQRPVLDYIREHLSPDVKYVDVYSELAAHVDEDIFLRTDHHWAPLGGYYAAKALARTAGAPFKDLSSYETQVTHGMVGSMYGYSHDISVKNSPEDFVYYVPKGLDYTTYYTTYKVDKNYGVISQSAPHTGKFFHHFKDGAGGAYLTFMSGDQHLVKVVTGTNSNRRLLIVKDSFGNAIPSNLFYSFGEIHVVDFRYFKENMKDYVHENGITDLVLFFNIFNSCGSTASNKVRKFLTQAKGDFSADPKAEQKVQNTEVRRDSVADKPKISGEDVEVAKQPENEETEVTESI